MNLHRINPKRLDTFRYPDIQRWTSDYPGGVRNGMLLALWRDDNGHTFGLWEDTAPNDIGELDRFVIFLYEYEYTTSMNLRDPTYVILPTSWYIDGSHQLDHPMTLQAIASFPNEPLHRAATIGDF